ncbi:glycoside hydrolase family 43 protein [Catenovulum sediminis]|uniref:Glycoside hydrolase family 43 protein n=1 Tax=Catenovulum sediminis TaxID=1740262 RepID=A0ABV1RC73_9ALTE|nr:glycoside hydrolase family 43 protein [Catenovulum sediminis]
MTDNKPLIEQRADPFIYKHIDGYYYFTASVPEYDQIELRRAKTIAGLADAEKVTAWRKPDSGAYSELIWAPEIHFNHDAWYVYFAAAPTRELKDGMFQHRMYAIKNEHANPLQGEWSFCGKIETGMDTFCLDATTFCHKGILYYVWAQKEVGIKGHSNIYIAPMETPTLLAGAPKRLTIPELEWETRGFWVNEGPAVIKKNRKVFISYSGSATDENYCIGLIYADEQADLLDPASWTKIDKPIFQTNAKSKMFGPGHNSFTVSEDNSRDVLVFHARNYTKIEGDPLWNPDRHTFVKYIEWGEDGMPIFGCPSQTLKN